MGFFKKNENEMNYYGGKKHIIDVIKNTGDGELLMWRQPEEDFNTHSKVIVMPGETAIFVDGGNVVQVFEPGTYQLSTNNYPFISRIKNQLSGGISSFNCVIYYFRKADSKELKWGTDSPISVRDKVHGILTDVRLRGIYKVRIVNPVLLLDKLVGSNINLQEQADLDSYFKTEIVSKVRATACQFINEYPNELIGMDAYLTEISDKIKPQLNQTLMSYGLECASFLLAAIDIDKSKYESIDESQVQLLKRAKEAQGEKIYMSTLGSDWDKMQAANIMTNLSQNEAVSGIGNIGIGLGVGAVTGKAFGEMASNIFAPEKKETEEKSGDELVVKLTKLKQLFDAGLIEQSEYETKKKELLENL